MYTQNINNRGRSSGCGALAFNFAILKKNTNATKPNRETAIDVFVFFFACTRHLHRMRKF